MGFLWILQKVDKFRCCGVVIVYRVALRVGTDAEDLGAMLPSIVDEVDLNLFDTLHKLGRKFLNQQGIWKSFYMPHLKRVPSSQ